MSKFRNAQNRLLTKALFYELNGYDVNDAIFTSDDKDKTVNGVKLISIRKAYMENDDPTEYAFAKQYFDSWRHWVMVRESLFFRELYKELKDEMEIMLRSRGLVQLVKMAEDSYQAAKYLADKGWEERIRGRPSDGEIKKVAKKEAKILSIVTSDLERIKSL